MVKTVYKTELMSVGLPADTYVRALESFCMSREDGDTSASMEDMIDGQNILDNSNLSEMTDEKRKRACAVIRSCESLQSRILGATAFLTVILKRRN